VENANKRCHVRFEVFHGGDYEECCLLGCLSKKRHFHFLQHFFLRSNEDFVSVAITSQQEGEQSPNSRDVEGVRSQIFLSVWIGKSV
jgi:hypothetical protein